MVRDNPVQGGHRFVTIYDHVNAHICDNSYDYIDRIYIQFGIYIVISIHNYYCEKKILYLLCHKYI